MAYLNLTDAYSRAKERAGATDDDYTLLVELLEMSKAPDASEVIHYRPFYVAAKYLEQNRRAQQISEADGVKFTGFATTIASLLGTQLAYDRSMGLVVPEGMEALQPDLVTKPVRFANVSVSSVVVP